MPHTLVTPEMRAKAQALRRFATKGESLLWYELRDLKTAGLKFRRQSPIGPYIADFVCFAPKIVVEVDGDHHETTQGKRHDANRDAYLVSSGFLVLRYDARDALDHAWHIAQEVRGKAEGLIRGLRPVEEGRRGTAEVTPPDRPFGTATLPARGRGISA